jgi:hypothetical protein
MNESRSTMIIRANMKFYTVLICMAIVTLCSCKKKEEAPKSDAPIRQAVQLQPSDLHPCEQTATELTTEDCEAAKYWFEQAKTGTAALSAPTRMWQGQSKHVTLAVGTASPPKHPSETEDLRIKNNQINQQPMSAASPAPNPKVDKTRHEKAVEPTPHEKAVEAEGADKKDFQVIDYYPFVGRRMSAELTGGGFTIKNLSEKSQVVSDGAVTTWEWEVTAKNYGPQKLNIKTTVEMIDSRNQHVPIKPTTEYKDIYVIIGPDGVLGWINSLPVWLKGIAAVFAGVAAVLTAWKKLRGKRR